MPRRFDFVSPGVQLTEIDQSTVPTTLEGDGPLIIGRATKGPANKPIRVRSYNDFVAVFGEPVYGPTANTPDSWRNGNTISPYYGSIAAQAWLSSEESPITFIRLLGDQADNVVDAGKAGWKTELNQTTERGTNGGAYGLFLISSGTYDPSNAANGEQLGTGSLAAVFYMRTGSMGMTGLAHYLSGASNLDNKAAALVSSVADGVYKVTVNDGDGNTVGGDSISFSFDPTADNYIRNVFNTDPSKINASVTPADSLETLFLGQTYEEMVNRRIATGTGNQFAILLGLATAEVSPQRFQTNLKASKPSKTGWFINRDENADTSSFDWGNMEKLFRLASLQDGEEFQKEYYVSIEDLSLGTSINPNSTFSVNIRKWSNNAIVESFAGLDVNPQSENFVAKRIGDMNMVWQATDKKFNITGDYANNSDFVRVELADGLKNGKTAVDTFALPFGFYGPMRPKSFALVSGSSTVGTLNAPLTAQTESFAIGSGSVPSQTIITLAGGAEFGVAMLANAATASFEFPSLRLTTINSNSKNGAINSNYLKNSLFGVNHVLSGSTTLDNSYKDIIRDLPESLDIHGDTASSALERSFVFTLDEIVRDANGLFYYETGSRVLGSSYSALSGTLKTIRDAKIKQFAAPFFGGFDGLDIREIDPFANRNIGISDAASYEFYTINKALDMAADAETTKMDLLALPGVNKSAVTNRMVEIADDRQDCLALVDLESAFTTSAEGTADESAGTALQVITSADARNFNSSYAAVYHPWVRVRSPGGNGTVVPVPPTVAAIGAIGKSQKLSYPWFAPAGFNRGGIGQLGGANGPIVTSVAETLNKANRDDLYESNINPIARLQGEFVIFGQKTLQQTPSALDRINVRRLMIYVKKQIGAIADTILFDNNIQATWNRFSSKANRVLSQIQSQGGIVEYKVQLDSSTTTPDLQDRNILYAKVYIKPARAIEFIAVDFIITRSGVQF